jgi:hypothetical protein
VNARAAYSLRPVIIESRCAPRGLFALGKFLNERDGLRYNCLRVTVQILLAKIKAGAIGKRSGGGVTTSSANSPTSCRWTGRQMYLSSCTTPEPSRSLRGWPAPADALQFAAASLHDKACPQRLVWPPNGIVIGAGPSMVRGDVKRAAFRAGEYDVNRHGSAGR